MVALASGRVLGAAAALGALVALDGLAAFATGGVLTALDGLAVFAAGGALAALEGFAVFAGLGGADALAALDGLADFAGLRVVLALAAFTAFTAFTAFLGAFAAGGMVVFPYGKGNSTILTVLRAGLPRGAQIRGRRNYQITVQGATVSLQIFQLAFPSCRQLLDWRVSRRKGRPWQGLIHRCIRAAALPDVWPTLSRFV